MSYTPKKARHSKGITLVELVKVLRVYRRTHPLVGLSPATEEVVSGRVIPNKWYPHEVMLEIIDAVFEKLLGSNEQKTIEAGILGGQIALQGYHRAFIKEGDPAASLMALRHIWKSYFDFGEHDAELDGEHAVIFTVRDYSDVTFCHAMLIIGWDVAAAQVAGATKVTYEVLEAPWQGASHLRYQVEFRP